MDLQAVAVAFGAGALGGYVAAWSVLRGTRLLRAGAWRNRSRAVQTVAAQGVAVAGLTVADSTVAAQGVAGGDRGGLVLVQRPDAMARVVTLRSGDRKVVTTPDYMRRFLAMPRISRKYWRGDKGVYSELREIALAEGWAVHENGRDVVWSQGWKRLRYRSEVFQERYRVRLEL